MAVVFKGGLYHYRSDGTSDDETITVDLGTGTLGTDLATGLATATGETIAAGDLIVTFVLNQYSGTNAGTFGDLLSYDPALILRDQFRADVPAAAGGGGEQNIHVFYRWATASESDVDIHVDGDPSDGVLGLSLVYSGLRGSGDPFTDQNTQLFNSYPINATGITNGGTWDPGTEQGAAVAVPPNNGGVVLAFYLTTADDGGMALNSANGFTSLGYTRTQTSVDRGELLIAYRAVDNGDAGSDVTPPTITNNTGSAETMLLLYALPLFAGVSRNRGFRYDLMSMSSAAKYRAFGGGLTGGSGTRSGGDTPITSGAPPPPVNYTQATSGVSDHGALTGLTPDDDHPQYSHVDGGKMPFQNHGNAGASETVNIATAYIHRLTLDQASCAITIAGAVGTRNGGTVQESIILELDQDATGGRVVTWVDTITWAGGSAPTLSTTGNARDVIVLYTVDGGTSYFGALVGGGGSGASALDDLSDVTETSPAQYDRLEYDGSGWVNVSTIWRPLLDGSGDIVVDGDGAAVMGLGPA